MTVIDMIRLIAPEFDNVSDVDLEQWIEFVKPFVSKKQFGKLYNQAMALLICHKMKVANLGVDDGMGTFADAVRFSSYSEGSRSVSFNNGRSGTSHLTDFNTLRFGRWWLYLSPLLDCSKTRSQRFRDLIGRILMTLSVILEVRR